MSEKFYNPIEFIQIVFRELVFTVKKHSKILLGPIIFFTIILVIVNPVAKVSQLSAQKITSAPSVAIMFAIWWIARIFAAMLFSLLLLHRHEKINIQELLKNSLNSIIPYFVVVIILTCVTVAGSIMLIIPGLIFGLWFSLAPVITLSEGKNGIAALTQSRKYVQNIIGILFVCNLLLGISYTVPQLILNHLVSFIPNSLYSISFAINSIISLIASMITATSLVITYEKAKILPKQDSEKSNRWIIISLFFIGLILIFALLLPFLNVINQFNTPAPKVKNHFPINSPSPYKN